MPPERLTRQPAFPEPPPGAGIVAVKLKPAKEYLRDYFLVQENAPAFQEDDCMLAVRYLQEQAQRLNLPLVVCFGLGTNQGGHDGHTPLDEGAAVHDFHGQAATA